MKIAIPSHSLIAIYDLLRATASAVHPDASVYHVIEGTNPRPMGRVSPQQQVRGMHRVALLGMLREGKVTARSLATRVPYGEFREIDYDWDRAARQYGLTFEDAKAFCAELAIELESTDQHTIGNETQEQRQARRHQLCVSAGLKMPNNEFSPMPRGIGKVADAEGISRQALTQDVKEHIARMNGR